MVDLSNNSLEHPLPSDASILYVVVANGLAGKFKSPPLPFSVGPTLESSESNLNW